MFPYSTVRYFTWNRLEIKVVYHINNIMQKSIFVNTYLLDISHRNTIVLINIHTYVSTYSTHVWDFEIKKKHTSFNFFSKTKKFKNSSTVEFYYRAIRYSTINVGYHSVPYSIVLVRYGTVRVIKINTSNY